MKNIHVYNHDLPSGLQYQNEVAIDTETMGLDINRDRLCLVQICLGDGICHIIKIDKKPKPAPNLISLLNNSKITKIFHYARFDMKILYKTFQVMCCSVYCTKISSKISRTNTAKHSLKDLCLFFLDIELMKEQQCSDWGAKELSTSQLLYASLDVIYLHQLKKQLDIIAKRENKNELIKYAIQSLTTFVYLEFHNYCPDYIMSYK